MKYIEIKGARQNNLKSVNVKIPLGHITVICGPSGSGKSSLAFETLFAQGQRSYTETLSNYARQYIQECPKPLVDSILSVPPSLALEQRNSVRSSRPTVATLTEIADLLKLLFTHLSSPVCPDHKETLVAYPPDRAARKITDTFKGSRGFLLMPLSLKAFSKNQLKKQLLKDGFYRVCWKDKKTSLPLMKDVRTLKTWPSDREVYVVLDRMVFEDLSRLTDSLQVGYTQFLRYNPLSLKARLEVLTTQGQLLHLSEAPVCSVCGYGFALPLQPSLFSANSSLGACPECKGFGSEMALDESKIVPDPSRSVAQGAIAPFAIPSCVMEFRSLKKFCRASSIDVHCPWKKLPDAHKKMIWKGSKEFKKSRYWSGQFMGIQGLFDYLETKKYKMHVRVFLFRYKSPRVCRKCGGGRFRPELSYVWFRGKSLPELLAMDIKTLTLFLKGIKWTSLELQKAREVIRKLLFVLNGLNGMGLHYLHLNREAKTLSSGEFQRLNLVHQLGLGLSQVLYVLDEPTVGLHPKDTLRLIHLLKKLTDLGNTLVVVEHDPDVIKRAGFVVELGPGAGWKGGQVVFDGSQKKFLNTSTTRTSYSLRLERIPKLFAAQPVDKKNYRYFLEVSGCRAHNLKNVTLRVPLNRLVTVTGVSGSGKTTLVTRTLYPALARTLGRGAGKPFPRPGLVYSLLKGVKYLNRVVLVDSSPVEKTKKSLPVTYLKFYDAIRTLMATHGQVVGRRLAGEIKPGWLSLNVEGGRCPECKGLGYQEIEMVFMDPVRLACEACQGKRFKPEILDLKWRGKNIHDILSMTVQQAMDFFVSYPQIWKPLSLLQRVGLEYLILGQSLSTLSGGEAQRLKLARELIQPTEAGGLYVLDEPSVGLHFREVRLLLQVLNQLIRQGNSVLMVEHNLELIRHSDYVIDMGPGAGEEGGSIVEEGTPEELTLSAKSVTGTYLKPFYRS